MPENDYVWIQTRDASPTLWNNVLGEPFRSFKGAFSESWTVFVEPALNFLKSHPEAIRVGEFGLGPGTNWILLSVAAKTLGFEISFFAIEKDPRSFEMGLKQWKEVESFLYDFLKQKGIEGSFPLVESLALPKVYESLDLAVEAQAVADIWFHDPFGFAVNPDGYQKECLLNCQKLWSPHTIGLSYACNRAFQKELSQLEGVEVFVKDIEKAGLKRSRLEFLQTI